MSFTDDPKTLQATRIRLDLKDGEAADLNVALGKAHAQQGHTSEAVASFTEAISLTADRAGKARIIAEAAPLAGVLEKLAGRAAGERSSRPSWPDILPNMARPRQRTPPLRKRAC